MVFYFGVLQHFAPLKVAIILLFSLIGIAGSYGVAWFGIRVNTFANSRAAFAGLRGQPYPIYAIPLSAGMSIGMLLISVELFLMLCILLFIPGDYAGACFIGFAIGESLGAAALRIAGGIFTKIADIGADLMKIVFNIKEDDARNPGVIADCTGDNAGDSVGPSADGFETYGVTGVALISFILVAVTEPTRPGPAARLDLRDARDDGHRERRVVPAQRGLGQGQLRRRRDDELRDAADALVWLTSIVSVVADLRRVVLADSRPRRRPDLWWKLSTVITCGTLAGAIIPELVKIFTSTESATSREVVISSREGGASLNILSGLVAGNFSAYWLGHGIVALMAIAYGVSTQGLGTAHDRAGGLRVRAGGVRLPRHGPGDDRGRLVRPGHGQRPVGLRAVDDRGDPEHQGGAEEGLRVRRELRARQAPARRERRRRQHLQGDGEAGADRHRRRRRRRR